MAAPVLPPRLREGDRLTRDEFMRRWEQMQELKRAELIDGIVHMPSPVSKTHSRSQSDLTYWANCYKAATPGCEVDCSPTWLMTENSAPQPDLVLSIAPKYGGRSRVEGEYAAGVPELVVEISYTTAPRDVGAKLRLYERSGVQEYLTVQPRQQQVVWRELVDGKYQEMTTDTGGWWRSHVFPGLWLNPAALWTRDLPGLAAAVQQGVATQEHREFVERLERSKH
ncbi:MAG TPA: Uma2 family endonuclease [Bryobacteraceae bacterium]